MSDQASPASGSKPSPRGRGTPRLRGGIQRQSKAERDQFVKDERERAKVLAAENETPSRGTRAGGPVISRSGRSNAAGTQRQAPVGGVGVFGGGGSVTPAQSKQRYEGYAELLVGGEKSAGTEDASQGPVDAEVATKGKSTGRSGGTSKGGKNSASRPAAGEIIEASTDDEPDDGPKRDIERIWISSEEDEEIATSTSRKGKQKAAANVRRQSRPGLGLRPVRAPRTQREEGEHGGQKDTSSSKKPTSTGKKLDSEPQELSSDERTGDAMDVDIDDVQLARDQPSTPEVRKRAVKSKVPGTSKHGREVKAAANETIEDRAERLRVQDDVEKLQEIFAFTADGSPREDDDEFEIPPEHGRLFLFQLPPLTPFLTDPNAVDNPEVKTESGPGAHETTIDLDTIPDAPAGSSTIHTSETIKPDPDGPHNKLRSPLQLDGLLTATEPTRLPSGMVGKLNVHRSGKVTLDWGGTDMEVKLGSEVDFLQDVVLVTPAVKQEEHQALDIDYDSDVDGTGQTRGKKEKRGKAFALGHVRHKMVLIPDWARLYD